MKYLLGLVLLLCVACSISRDHPSASDLEKKISEIPLLDRQKLEVFFRQMLTCDYFACTLYGKKPLTFQEFHEDPWKLSSYSMVNPYIHFYLDEGWQTWRKYQASFHSERFIFTKLVSKKEGYEFLILINNAAFKEMFNDNLDLFKTVLGSDVTAESLLADFRNAKKPFFQILNRHEGLLGLVLGYGREGSMLVHRDWSLKLRILRNALHPLNPVIDEQKLPQRIATSLHFLQKNLSSRGVKWHQLVYEDVAPQQDPYAELCKKDEQCEFLFPPWQERIYHILPPNCTVVKGSEEAKQLEKDYNIAMRIARSQSNKKSFLIGFLDEYCKKMENYD